MRSENYVSEVTRKKSQNPVLNVKIMAKELKITVEKVRETIDLFPDTREVLENLFPEAKKDPLDDKFFIKIGQPFLRRGVSIENIYALVVVKGRIKVRNFKGDYLWESINEVFNDASKDYLTQGEFKNLMQPILGKDSNPLQVFVPIPTTLLSSYINSEAAFLHVYSEKRWYED